MSSGSPLLISLGPVGPSEANVQNDRPSLMRPAPPIFFDVRLHQDLLTEAGMFPKELLTFDHASSHRIGIL